MQRRIRTSDVVAIQIRDFRDVAEYTVKAFAAKEQVSEKTVRLWIKKGAVCVRRTPGGGLRIVERREIARATN